MNNKFDKKVLLLPKVEELFNLESEPPLNCPTIDGYITDIKRAIGSIEDLKQLEDDSGDVLSIADDISYYVDDVPGQMEHLRSKIEELRQWGNSWKELFIDLVHRLDIDLRDEEFYSESFSMNIAMYNKKMKNYDLIQQAKKVNSSEVWKIDKLIEQTDDEDTIRVLKGQRTLLHKKEEYSIKNLL